MSKIFIVPDHLHQSSRVLSCSDEAGLCAAAPVNGSSNAGRLRLSAAGGTEEAVELDLLLRTGGNPYGYRLADNYTGNGASVVWKNSADGTTSYRGYVDTPYFVRSAEFGSLPMVGLESYSTTGTLFSGPTAARIRCRQAPFPTPLLALDSLPILSFCQAGESSPRWFRTRVGPQDGPPIIAMTMGQTGTPSTGKPSMAICRLLRSQWRQ